jgi:hypothetical protein
VPQNEPRRDTALHAYGPLSGGISSAAVLVIDAQSILTRSMLAMAWFFRCLVNSMRCCTNQDYG